MPRPGLDKVAELSSRLLPRIGLLDAFDSFSSMFDRAALVGFAQVQMQRARGDQTGHLGCITKRKPAGNKVRKAVQDPFFVNARIRRQAAVADRGLNPWFVWANQPGMCRTIECP